MPAATVVSREDLPLLLTVRQVQEIAGVSKTTSYELVNRAGFPRVRLGRAYRVPRDAFLRWVEEEAAKNGGDIA